MKINLISTFENARGFLLAAGNAGADVYSLWRGVMVEPFWDDISRWAPFDQGFKQPPCVTDLAALKEQLPVLFKLPLDELKVKFEKITLALPCDDDEPMSVYLYPACDSDKALKERQNGVVGTSVFGNVIIRVNPLAEGFEKWLEFVFAHEYHHNIWGHSNFVLRGGRDCDGSLLEYMVTEGQADLFAESLFPELTPSWNRPFDSETQARLWGRLKPVLASTDHETYAKFMFGDESDGLPWCMGYSFGRMIVADYMKKNPGLKFPELIEIPAKKFLV